MYCHAMPRIFVLYQEVDDCLITSFLHMNAALSCLHGMTMLCSCASACGRRVWSSLPSPCEFICATWSSQHSSSFSVSCSRRDSNSQNTSCASAPGASHTRPPLTTHMAAKGWMVGSLRACLGAGGIRGGRLYAASQARCALLCDAHAALIAAAIQGCLGVID